MQLIECLIYSMCAHIDYKNLLTSLLGSTIYPIDPYHPATGNGQCNIINSLYI